MATRYLVNVKRVPNENLLENNEGGKMEPIEETLPLPGFEELLKNNPQVPNGNLSGSDMEPSNREDEFNLFWESYPVKFNKRDAFLAFTALRKTVSLEEIAQAHNGYLDFLKHQRVHNRFEQAPMYPATFLRKERWKSYIGFQYKARL